MKIIASGFIRKCVLCLVLGLMSSVVLAQIPSQLVTVHGTSVTKLKGVLKGPNKSTRDYIVHVKEGGTLSVALTASNKSSTYFNVLPPSSEVALYVSAMDGKHQWEQKVQAEGNYTVRIYLNRAAARKGTSSHYTLSIASF